MKSLLPPWTDTPSLPTVLYWLAAALLMVVGALLVVAQVLKRTRERSDALLLQQLHESSVEAAAGQPDQPADVDQLQFGIAPVLASLLTHPLTNEPYTIALSGGWGSGKSSVMQQLKKQLQAAKTGFHFAHINVWHFQAEDQFLTEFLRRTLEQLKDRGFRRRRIAHNLRELGFGRTLYRSWLLTLALPVLLLGCWVLLQGIGQYLRLDIGLMTAFRQSVPVRGLARLLNAPFYVLRYLPQALPTIGADKSKQSFAGMLPSLTGLATLLTLAGSVLAALRRVPDLIKPLIQLIPYQQEYELAQGPAGLRQRYQQEFGTIIRDAAGATLLIFVDDIDRISGSRVLELLETLNFIVTSAQDRRSGNVPGAKLYFVLAMNVPEVVRVLGPALDPTGKLPENEAKQLAANYLAKLVDLTVNIPSLHGRDIQALHQLQPNR